MSWIWIWIWTGWLILDICWLHSIGFSKGFIAWVRHCYLILVITSGARGYPIDVECDVHAFAAPSHCQNLRAKSWNPWLLDHPNAHHLRGRQAQPLTKKENAASPPPPEQCNGLNPSTMLAALLLRPLALVLGVSLAALAVDARQDILCQSARIERLLSPPA